MTTWSSVSPEMPCYAARSRVVILHVGVQVVDEKAVMRNCRSLKNRQLEQRERIRSVGGIIVTLSELGRKNKSCHFIV